MVYWLKIVVNDGVGGGRWMDKGHVYEFEYIIKKFVLYSDYY